MPAIRGLTPAGWVGPVSGGILAAVAVGFIVVSLIEIADLGDGEGWRTASILLAAVVASIVSFAYLFRFARQSVTTAKSPDRLDQMTVPNGAEVEEREPKVTAPAATQGGRPRGN